MNGTKQIASTISGETPEVHCLVRSFARCSRKARAFSFMGVAGTENLASDTAQIGAFYPSPRKGVFAVANAPGFSHPAHFHALPYLEHSKPLQALPLIKASVEGLNFRANRVLLSLRLGPGRTWGRKRLPVVRTISPENGVFAGFHGVAYGTSFPGGNPALVAQYVQPSGQGN